SLTMGAGQFCTNPGLVLAIEGEGLDAFVAAAAEAIGGHSPQTMLTSGIREAYAKGVAKLAGSASEVASGPAGDGKTCEAARLFTVSGGDALARPELLDEVFGAASLVIRCADAAELARVLESLEGQLTATLHL